VVASGSAFVGAFVALRAEQARRLFGPAPAE
jgi:hypothetical protein